MAQPELNERKWIWLLCLLAAIHVFIFSAAFPFFNNVDEPLHFDTIVRYSHGDIPRMLAAPCEESLQFILVYATPEYLWPEKAPPPNWTLPISKIAPNLLQAEAVWKEKIKNQEASQPPLYYAIAGLWWRMGHWLHFDGGTLLYWLRFLNIIFMVALVWVGYAAARLVFPDNLFLKIGVPALLAFMPQTAFYSLGNDMLSALFFGVAFILLAQFSRAETPGLRLGTITGLALAATFLTKISNLPFLSVSAVFVVIKIFHLTKNNKIRLALPAIGSLVLCGGLPILLWLLWCKHTFGDFTGSEAKIQFLGWTHKPFSEWWHHPIFTAPGFWTFIHDLLATFWQGEIWWHRKPLALPLVNTIYLAATLIFIGMALLNLLPKFKTTTPPQRQALWFGFACFIAAIAFLGFLSIIYDFHDCFNPSREHPYFTSGRLMLGALIPFLLLFLFGLDRVLSRIKNNWIRPLALIVMILFMLVSEITIDWRIFPNVYNWFHM